MYCHPIQNLRSAAKGEFCSSRRRQHELLLHLPGQTGVSCSRLFIEHAGEQLGSRAQARLAARGRALGPPPWAICEPAGTQIKWGGCPTCQLAANGRSGYTGVWFWERGGLGAGGNYLRVNGVSSGTTNIGGWLIRKEVLLILGSMMGGSHVACRF